MKPEDERILKMLDRDVVGEAEAAGEGAGELARLHEIVTELRGLETLEAPLGFTERVMASLPQRRSLWARFKDFLMRPHVIKLNLAWEAGLVAALLAVGIQGYGLHPHRVVAIAERSFAPVVHARFIVKAPKAREVTLAGDFNNWRRDQYRLTRAEADGVWTVTVPLHPGRYKYMFVVDGQKWQTDPLAESYEHDGFGNENAVVEIPSPEQA